MERYPVRRKITIVKEYYEYGKISGDDFQSASESYRKCFYPDKGEKASETRTVGEFELLENEFVGYSQEEINEILNDRDLYAKINQIMDEFSLRDYTEERNKIKSIFLERHGREITTCQTEDCDAWGYKDEMLEFYYGKIAHKSCLEECPSCGKLTDKCMIEANSMCEDCLD